MYKINEDFDFFNWNDFQNQILLQENKLWLIANRPDSMTVQDYVFILSDATITEVWRSEFKSENKEGILKA